MTKKALNQNAKYVQELIKTIELNFNFENKPINRFAINVKDHPGNDTNKLDQLNSLRSKISSIQNCNLMVNSKNLVMGDGDINSPIMIIGEAPGELEDKSGYSFQGEIGSLLKKMLSAINIKIDKLSNGLKNLMKYELYQIKKTWPKNLPAGIIHCDLFADNIIFYKKKFHGFIDFYFSCNDYLSYELATSVNALCFVKKKNKYILDKKRCSNLLKGYESIRKLSGSEKKHFNTMCRGSALRYLLTRAYDYLNTPKSAIVKIKDPKEYIQKLNYHRKINSYKNYIND